jgi:hypothetical protein
MLEFSQTGTRTISKVLPLYKMIQQHLESTLRDPDLITATFNEMWNRVERFSLCHSQPQLRATQKLR